MTDERDPKLQSAYRALGAEEPPRALDEAILAAARRPVAAGRPPVRSWTQRWAVPLSLAAVVVLSVTVTLRIQHEQPGIEMPAPAKKDVARADGPAATAPQPQPQPQPQLPPKAEAPAPAKAQAELDVGARQQRPSSRKEAEAFPRSSQDRAAAENRAAEAVPAPTPPAETRLEAPALAKRADARAEVGSVAGSVAATPAPAPAAPAMREMQRDRAAAERLEVQRSAPTPEQELERIAGLRKEHKHDEADKALAEFRKRHPDFKIPAAMLERVERR